MREKLLDLMKNEGLKPSQLAEMLEINPAGISHILAGRNKPGFDLLQKILRRFPQISPDWLMLDKGPMYRADKSPGTNTSVIGTPEINAGSGNGSASFAPHAGNELFQAGSFSSAPTSGVHTSPGISGHPANSGTSGVFGSTTGSANSRQISAAVSRIVIFYDDQTCETYSPTKQ